MGDYGTALFRARENRHLNATATKPPAPSKELGSGFRLLFCFDPWVFLD